MAKKYVLTVITHVRMLYTFDSLEKLHEFIDGYLQFNQSYKRQLLRDGYVHVPSNYRANSLDLYNIYDYDDYAEEYNHHLDASKNEIENTNDKLKQISNFIDDKDEMIILLNEDFRQKIMINDMKNKSVLLNLAIAITKLDDGVNLFKMIESQFYKESNQEVIETYERLFK